MRQILIYLHPAATGPHAGFPMWSRRLAIIIIISFELILETAPCAIVAPVPPMPAYIIALRPKELAVAKPISLLSSVASLTVVTANNGSESELGLPLYIRYVLSHGRSEHSQIGNRAALGCLRSHMDVWARVVRSGVPSIVLEEDILVSSDSDFKLARFLEYFGPSGPAWDILMLDPGHLNTGGQWGPVGPYAANCTDPNGCTWFGTRAYAIRPAGAALLLSQADPPLVQVDALVSLVSNYFAPASGNGTA